MNLTGTQDTTGNAGYYFTDQIGGFAWLFREDRKSGMGGSPMVSWAASAQEKTYA